MRDRWPRQRKHKNKYAPLQIRHVSRLVEKSCVFDSRANLFSFVNLTVSFAIAREGEAAKYVANEAASARHREWVMRFAKSILVILFSILGALTTARATTQIHIDLTTQTMHVESSSGSYTWPVSTARSGYSTPRGSYAPTGLQRMHYSKKYHMSPMPYSIFFRGGYAIHGTYATGALGRPASHGCVRLSPAHAAELYHMVQTEGGSISISGAPPGSTRFASAHHRARMMLASHQRRGRTEALAYAPPHHRHFLGVRDWQADPYYSPYPYNYGGF